MGDLGESDAETSASNAVNIETTLPSARERIIFSVGAPVVIPPVC